MGSNVIQVMNGIGDLAVVLILAVVLFKIGKFVDALAEMIKKD